MPTATAPTTTATLIHSYNPSTGEIVGSVPITPVDQIPSIVARSKAAQVAWGELTAQQRRDILAPVGEALLAKAETYGRQLTLEMGKPLQEGIGEVKGCATGWTEELDEIAHALQTTVIEDESTRSEIHRDPLGVNAAITPWNFPMLMPHWQILPSLVAGNSVVFKPSELTPLTAQAYADELIRVLPKDVLIVVHGDGAQGATLVAADDVDLITFTGSRETGKKILAEASRTLKRCILELGGKDPLLVLEGADIEAAATFAARNSFRNAGQVCVSTERIYVTDKVYDTFMETFVKKSAEIKPGDGLQEGASIGPLIARKQKDHVQRQIRDAIAKGATLVAGDPGNSGPDDNFMPPTILANVNHTMEVATEETFGPVACVVRVKDDNEAVKLANDTKFGLGGVVFGEPQRAAAAGRKLTSAMVGINRGIGGARAQGGTPWIGAKESGYGFHGGPEGHRQFTQTRVVSSPKN